MIKLTCLSAVEHYTKFIPLGKLYFETVPMGSPDETRIQSINCKGAFVPFRGHLFLEWVPSPTLMEEIKERTQEEDWR